MIVVAAAGLVVLTSCGSSGGGDEGAPAGGSSPAATDAGSETIASTSPPDAPPTTAGATEPPATEPPATVPPVTEPPASTLPEPAEWQGPVFDEAIEPTMDALAVGVGQPVSASAVAPEIVLPDALPTPGGIVSGAGWESEIDGFDGGVELTYSVGLDAELTPDGLEAWQTSVGDGDPAWRAPSFAESGSLYTSLLVNEATDERLVHVLDTEAASSGRPPLNLQWGPDSDALLEPEWLAALPRPEGGTTSEVLVARGRVSAGLGALGYDGNVFVRTDYSVEDIDRMVEYFESGVLLGAGFEYEPSPISNTRYRRDVTIGAWSGEVAIGRATLNDTEFLQVIWSLVRGGP